MKRELRGVDVARAMKLSHQRIYQFEQMRRVPQDVAARYLEALEAAACVL